MVPTPKTSSPRVAAVRPSVGLTAGAAVQSRRKTGSWPPVATGALGTVGARRTRDSAQSTGTPSASTAVSRTDSSPSRVIRTRSVVAPLACRETPFQAKGSSGFSSLPTPR